MSRREAVVAAQPNWVRLLLLATLVATTAGPTAASAQDYRRPLEPPGAGRRTPYVTAYRDLDGGGGIKDWNCGRTAYNGHRGTDIGIGGFAAMDSGSVWVVAAARGRVTHVVEGCFDRCTTADCQCGGGFGNYVRVTDPDGKSTYYGHLKRGSVQVQNGAQVSCGQRLGKVGSSGRSTGPHLHFEPRYASNVSDDPFAGRCGGPTSFWVNQGAHRSLPGVACEGGAPPPPPPPPPASRGSAKGVVFDGGATDAPNAPGNVRLPGARVTVRGRSEAATARSPDGFWSIDLPAGRHALIIALAGFDRVTRAVDIQANADTWASQAMLRSAATGTLKGVVFDKDRTATPSAPGNRRIDGATIEVVGRSERATARAPDGFWSIRLPAGRHEFTVRAPGYRATTRAVDVAGTGDTWGSVGLLPVVTNGGDPDPVDPPPADPTPDPPPPPDSDKPVVDLPASPPAAPPLFADLADGDRPPPTGSGPLAGPGEANDPVTSGLAGGCSASRGPARAAAGAWSMFALALVLVGGWRRRRR